MANEFLVNVYQIDQKFLARDQSQRIGFPSVGVLIGSCIDSPQRSLASGYNVYSVINFGGHLYYCGETISQLASTIA